MSLLVADASGAPVATVESLVLRPVSAVADSGPAAPEPLYRLAWTPIPKPDAVAVAVPLSEIADEVPELVVADAKTVTEVLELVQSWISEERFADSKLVLRTRGAVHTDADPAVAAVWGLVRSAQAEHPGRFVLVDAPDGELLDAALATAEPQVAIRGGDLFIPRVTRGGGALQPPSGERAWRLDTRAKGTLDNLVLVPSPEAVAPLMRPRGPGRRPRRRAQLPRRAERAGHVPRRGRAARHRGRRLSCWRSGPTSPGWPRATA